MGQGHIRGLDTANQGQAIVEFMLLLILAVLMIAGLKTAFETPVKQLWKQLACEIAAPCPTCLIPTLTKESLARISSQPCKQRTAQ
jgi:Flp pilus assembly pilin Flp